MEISKLLVNKIISGQGTEAEKLAAVEYDGSLIAYLNNPSEEIKKAAVMKNPYALKFIADPTNELLEFVAKESPSAAAYIEKPTANQIKILIKANPKCIRYIRKGITKTHWIDCISRCPSLIRYIPRDVLTKDICRQVGLSDYTMVGHIPSRFIDKSLAKEFVQAHGLSIQYLNPEVLTDEIKILAIKNDRMAGKYVKSIGDVSGLMPLIDDNKEIIDYLTPMVMREVCLKYRERFLEE